GGRDLPGPCAEGVHPRRDDLEPPRRRGSGDLEPEPLELAPHLRRRIADARTALQRGLLELGTDFVTPIDDQHIPGAAPERGGLGVHQLVLFLHANSEIAAHIRCPTGGPFRGPTPPSWRKKRAAIR